MWIKSDHRDSVCEYGGKLGKHFILEVGGEDLNNQIRCFRLHIVEMEEDSMEIIQKKASILDWEGFPIREKTSQMRNFKYT